MKICPYCTANQEKNTELVKNNTIDNQKKKSKKEKKIIIPIKVIKVKCKYCNEEIDSDMKFCPYCKEKQ